MSSEVVELTPNQLGPLRAEYRAENPLQIIHDSLHDRSGWATSWGFAEAGELVGYGSIAKAGPWEGKPTLFEMFLRPRYLHLACKYLNLLLEIVKPVQIETQSNIPLLSTLALSICRQVESESLLFEDRVTTTLEIFGASIRVARDSDREVMTARNLDQGAASLMEVNGEVVGSGGYLTHYNPPFADLYMTIAEGQRRRGYGKWLVQELKRQIREQALVPAARCRISNRASSQTLQAAGFAVCGVLFCGKV